MDSKETTAIPTGSIEFLDMNKGIFINDTDLEKYRNPLLRLQKNLEDSLDQNMINYCDYVVYSELVKLLTVGSNTKNYIVVCNCSN